MQLLDFLNSCILYEFDRNYKHLLVFWDLGSFLGLTGGECRHLRVGGWFEKGCLHLAVIVGNYWFEFLVGGNCW